MMAALIALAVAGCREEARLTVLFTGDERGWVFPRGLKGERLRAAWPGGPPRSRSGERSIRSFFSFGGGSVR